MNGEVWRTDIASIIAKKDHETAAKIDQFINTVTQGNGKVPRVTNGFSESDSKGLDENEKATERIISGTIVDIGQQ